MLTYPSPRLTPAPGRSGEGTLIAGSRSYHITLGGQASVILPLCTARSCDGIPVGIRAGELLEIRLLHDATSIPSCGEAGMHRFRHDVLSVQGIRTVIFALGTNDIGQPGTLRKTPSSQLPGVEEFSPVVGQLARETHEAGLRSIATTIAARVLTWTAATLSIQTKTAESSWRTASIYVR
ncbi:MAG: hypothetical protein WCQ50_21485 [Spirochaetota bacterium]